MVSRPTHRRPGVLRLAGWVAAALLATSFRAGGGPPPLFSRDGGAPIAPQQTPKGIHSQSAQSCQPCHATIYEEWRSSMHSAAWNDAQFQELWRSAGRESACLNCHSPLQIQQAVADGKPNPGFQPTVQQEGVTCAACHVRDGKILGIGSSTGKSLHPVAKVPSLAEASFCSSCHQLRIDGRAKGLYDTYREWKSTDWARRGVTCQECHMPRRMGNVATGVQRSYRSHDFRGAHSDLLLERALTVLVTLDKPQYEAGQTVRATVLVRNSGAAHHVPSGDPQHQIRVLAGLADRRGKMLQKTEMVLARDMTRQPPFRERSDSRLAAGSSRRLTFEGKFPGGLGEHYFVVQVSYHLMPPEQAHELGIAAEVTSRIFHSQIIPITP